MRRGPELRREPTDHEAEISAIQNLSDLNALRFAQEHGYWLRCFRGQCDIHDKISNGLGKNNMYYSGLPWGEEKQYYDHPWLRTVRLTGNELYGPYRDLFKIVKNFAKIITDKHREVTSLTAKIKDSQTLSAWKDSELYKKYYVRPDNIMPDVDMQQKFSREADDDLFSTSWAAKYIDEIFDEVFHSQTKKLEKIEAKAIKEFIQLEKLFDEAITLLSAPTQTKPLSPYR